MSFLDSYYEKRFIKSNRIVIGNNDLIIIYLFIFNILDLLTTYIMLSNGGIEQNPFMAILFEHFWVGAIVKMLLCFLALSLLYYTNEKQRTIYEKNYINYHQIPVNKTHLFIFDTLIYFSLCFYVIVVLLNSIEVYKLIFGVL